MESLNNKIRSTRADNQFDAQSVGVYGYNSTSDIMKRIEATDNNHLKVAVASHLVDSPDLKARTDIADSSTSTFLKCDNAGKLEVEATLELDSSTLAKEAKQDTMITDLGQIATNTSRLAPQLNRTEAIPVQIMVGSGGTEYDALRANGQDLMVMIDDMNPDVAVNSGLSTAVLQTAGNTILTDGSQQTKCMGLFSGTQVQLKVDANGVLETSGGGGGGGDATAANQVLQLAQETIIAGDTSSLDAKITACNTGAVVVSSSALPTGAATEATLSTVDGKITACNTGAVVVSSSALPTGGATSSNQTTANSSLSTIAGDTTSIDGKITTGADATLTTAQQMVAYGRDSVGGLGALKVDNAGHLEVVQDAEQLTSTIFSGTQTIASSNSHTFTTTLDKNGSSQYNLLITSTTSATDIDYSIATDNSDDNSTFYTNANSGGGGGGGGSTDPVVVGIQNAQVSFTNQTSRYVRITFTNTGLATLTITSVKATRVNGL
jgi:hypothetical protein